MLFPALVLDPYMSSKTEFEFLVNALSMSVSTKIYIAHKRETSNALYALVRGGRI